MALIGPTLAELKKNFQSGETKNLEWRKEQLRCFLQGVTEMSNELQEAVHKDLNKSNFQTYMFELNGCEDIAKDYIDNIDKFAADDVMDPSILFAPARHRLVWEPLGVVLVFGSWNFPYFVNLKPLVNAIAAGNAAIVKPSELAPASSAAIKKLVEKYLDNKYYRVIEGGVQVAINITSQPFDLICFTGSTEKGKLVQASAAKNLVPTILELGGKCPLIVSENANVDFAAFKIASFKFPNSGQTCINCDHIFVHQPQMAYFKERLLHHIKTMYVQDPKDKEVFQ